MSFHEQFERQLREAERGCASDGTAPTLDGSSGSSLYDSSSSSYESSDYSGEDSGDFSMSDDEINGLTLNMQQVQTLRTSTSQTNLFCTGLQALMQARTGTGRPQYHRSMSAGAPQSSGMSYALQTKPATESSYLKDTVPKPINVLFKLLKENGQPNNKIPFHSLSWVKGSTAAYTLELMAAVRNDDLEAVQAMHTRGSPLQCCNKFGETILHAIARHGRLEILQYLVDTAGVSLQVHCDGGRTPLHDACWTTRPHFECVQFILKRHPNFLLVADKRGFLPLDYVPRDSHDIWNDFLESNSSLLFAVE